MNPLLCNPSEFCALVQRFFAERLIAQQNASPRTVAAYRDTFRLLLAYAQDTLGKAPTALSLGEFDARLILGFLDHLESARHNSIRSRNARLAALRAFAHYVALQCPVALHLTQQILAIPAKRLSPATPRAPGPANSRPASASRATSRSIPGGVILQTTPVCDRVGDLARPAFRQTPKARPNQLLTNTGTC